MSIGTVTRRRRRARLGLPAEPSVFVMRNAGTSVPPFRDTRVLYPLDVAQRKIDRTAWAGIVRKILDEEYAGNKTAFAAAIDSDRKTINRWLDEDVDVSEEMVRKVARRHSLSPMDLLIQVGYYGTQDVRSEPAAPVADSGDAATKAIRSAKVRPSVKRDLNKYVAERRAEFERQLLADIERIISAELRAQRTA